MSEADDAFERRLLTLFADEARGHLAHIDAVLAELARAGAAAQAAPLRAVLDALHTLKGAARAVALGELEYLCHALDGVFVAAVRSGATLQPDQLAVIRAALELAGQLFDQSAGRVRNQALALGARLDELARALGAHTSPEPGA
jgi:two-component system chemotaxis sensor kinase CheA